jgi:hypothetical protein
VDGDEDADKEVDDESSEGDEASEEVLRKCTSELLLLTLIS